VNPAYDRLRDARLALDQAEAEVRHAVIVAHRVGVPSSHAAELLGLPLSTFYRRYHADLFDGLSDGRASKWRRDRRSN
jgi:DNA-directed RNA polymerase specialized sigma24 family protein